MKITVLGFLAVVAVVMLVGWLAYQVGTELDKGRPKNNEQPDGSF